jgi:xylulokinase
MHFRWLLETEEQKIKTNEVMRFTGGSAMTPLVAQILSDVTGRPVEVTEEPRQVGTQGAAVTIGIGLGVYKTTQETKDFIRVANTYTPNMKNKDVYDRIFPVFKDLYNDNKKSFAKLNADLKMN